MKIDYSKDKLLTEFSHKTLEDRYLVGDEKSPQEAFARAATAFADDEDHAQRLYDYASNLWFMFSTPVLSNGGTERGMPISCFLNYVEDSREGITDHYTENAYLSSFGGGIGGSWSAVRSQGTSTSKGSEYRSDSFYESSRCRDACFFTRSYKTRELCRLYAYYTS